MALDSRSRQAIGVATITSPHASQVVGIVLVRNEDVFVERAVRNVVAFCDKLLLVDHQSSDNTWEILQKLAAEFPHVSAHAISHPRESHDLLQPFVGTRTWIFGVDGDEVYDPQQLQKFRVRLDAGEFDHQWMILGNVLNVTDLAADRSIATGHLAPPCRSMTKFYNFAAIEAWDGDTTERLHGGNVKFRSGFHNAARSMLHEHTPWELADFRCLHLCFLQRSSQEVETPSTPRQNIMETFGPSRWHGLWRGFLRIFGITSSSDWKTSAYRRGPAVTLPVRNFFPSA